MNEPMSPRQYRTLTKRIVDRLAVDDKDTVFRDRELPGFGLRVYPSGKKVFVVQTRAFGRSKRVTLGRYPALTPEAARKDATAVIARIKKGQSPVPPEPAPVPTVADLAERYQREYVETHCKPATVSHYRLMLRKHIVPALGDRLVADVEHKDILSFQICLIGTPLPKCSRRIRAIVSTISISPHLARPISEASCCPLQLGGQSWTPITPVGGSIFHAE